MAHSICSASCTALCCPAAQAALLEDRDLGVLLGLTTLLLGIVSRSYEGAAGARVQGGWGRGWGSKEGEGALVTSCCARGAAGRGPAGRRKGARTHPQDAHTHRARASCTHLPLPAPRPCRAASPAARLRGVRAQAGGGAGPAEAAGGDTGLHLLRPRLALAPGDPARPHAGGGHVCASPCAAASLPWLQAIRTPVPWYLPVAETAAGLAPPPWLPVSAYGCGLLRLSRGFLGIGAGRCSPAELATPCCCRRVCAGQGAARAAILPCAGGPPRAQGAGGHAQTHPGG